MKGITFVRHGETTANQKGLFAGKSEWELTEKGLSEARSTAEKLKNIPFDTVYCGNALRVRQTFKIVQKASNHAINTVVFTDEIREIDFGEWEGLSYRTISECWSEKWNEYMTEWDRFTFPGGDDIRDYFENCGKFIKSCVRDNPKKNIAVFAHKGFILACCCVLRGQPIRNMFDLDIQTGSFFFMNIGEKLSF